MSTTAVAATKGTVTSSGNKVTAVKPAVANTQAVPQIDPDAGRIEVTLPNGVDKYTTVPSLTTVVFSVTGASSSVTLIKEPA